MAGLMVFHTLILRTNRHLAESQQVQARMTERASSGLRVNSARDDASALVRSNASQAMLSQANAAPQQVLDMLLGGMKSRG